MRRRCLDCHTLRDGGPACLACGSRAEILLGSEHEEPSWSAPAALLGAHALLCTAATNGHPGFLLGNMWFAEGLCAALLAVGVDRAARAARLVVAAAVLIHLAYLVFTTQTAFAGLGVGILLASVALLQEDRTRVSVRAARMLACVLTGLLSAGVLAALYHRTPPGWWQGEHPTLRAPPAAPPGEQR